MVALFKLQLWGMLRRAHGSCGGPWRLLAARPPQPAACPPSRPGASDQARKQPSQLQQYALLDGYNMFGFVVEAGGRCKTLFILPLFTFKLICASTTGPVHSEVPLASGITIRY
jgi:hypothetical protein